MPNIRILGEQSVTDSTTGVVLTRSPRTVALIAFLTTHAGRPQTRQRIAALFWPDSTDAQALTNLRRELHQLRQVLAGDPALVVTSKDLCWQDTGTSDVDVRTFDVARDAALAAVRRGDTAAVARHAATAVAAYRGELLPGVDAEWVADVRAELDGRCVALCDLLCDARERGGDLAGAVEAAGRRVTLRPLEEIGYRTLIRLQVALGDRGGAVGTYHRCASILERELGIAPDRVTQELVRPLLARPRQHRDAAADRSGLSGAALVGRGRELDALALAWRRAVAGRPGLVLVRGSAGVGKTRLLAEVAELARRQGAVVATAQCFGTSGRLALAPVADWLRSPAVRPAVATLEPVWRAEVDRLLPTGGDRATAAASTRAMVDAWQRYRFFEGLARAFTAVDRPLLLVLDNLQWCDQETLAFLPACLGLARGAPVLVAATLRDDDLDDAPELVRWIRDLRASGRATELPLGPLDAADTATLAEAVSGRRLPPDDVRLLQAATGGFPLYVVEAVRTAVDLGTARLPAGDLTSVLRGRIDQVGTAAQETAGLAAAVGRDFTLDLLVEASGQEPDVVVAAVDELWRRRIVRELPDGYDFSHDLLRDAAYARVSPPRRWLLHRRLAQSLERLHPDDTDAVSAQLAEQYARGGRPDRAVVYYRRAADIAASTFAHAEAIRLHQAALGVLRGRPDGRRRQEQELAVLEAMAAPLTARHGFAAPELRRTLERSVEVARELGRTDSVLAGLVSLWASQFVQGDIAGAHQGASHALTLVAPGSELYGSAQFAFGGSALTLGRPAEALRHFELAAELTAGAASWTVGTRPDVHGRAWAAHAHWLLGDDAAAAAAAAEAIALARAIEHPFNLAVALAYAGITHQLRGDRAALRPVVAELRGLCDRYGFAYYREWGKILAGWSELDGSGVELARRGVDDLRAQGAVARMPYWLSLLADVLHRHGKPEAARATLDAALVAGQVRDDLWWLPEVLRMRSAYDEPADAVRRLRSAARLAADQGSGALARRCERDLAGLGVPVVDGAVSG